MRPTDNLNAGGAPAFPNVLVDEPARLSILPRSSSRQPSAMERSIRQKLRHAAWNRGIPTVRAETAILAGPELLGSSSITSESAEGLRDARLSGSMQLDYRLEMKRLRKQVRKRDGAESISCAGQYTQVARQRGGIARYVNNAWRSNAGDKRGCLWA